MNRLYFVSILLLAILAVTVYRAKLEVRDSHGTLRELQGTLVALEEEISILRAEEGHLTRPQRLHILARDRLGLRPLQSVQIGTVGDLVEFGAVAEQ